MEDDTISKKIHCENNTLLLVPERVLQTYWCCQGIKDFQALRDATPNSALEKVCHLIRTNSENILKGKFDQKEALLQQIDQLEESEKVFLYCRIGVLTQWEGHFLDHIDLIVPILGKWLREKESSQPKFL